MRRWLDRLHRFFEFMASGGGSFLEHATPPDTSQEDDPVASESTPEREPAERVLAHVYIDTNDWWIGVYRGPNLLAHRPTSLRFDPLEAVVTPDPPAVTEEAREPKPLSYEAVDRYRWWVAEPEDTIIHSNVIARFIATIDDLTATINSLVEAAEELSGLWHHLPNDHSETVAAMQRLDARLDAWHTGGGE